MQKKIELKFETWDHVYLPTRIKHTKERYYFHDYYLYDEFVVKKYKIIKYTITSNWDTHIEYLLSDINLRLDEKFIFDNKKDAKLFLKEYQKKQEEKQKLETELKTMKNRIREIEERH